MHPLLRASSVAVLAAVILAIFARTFVVQGFRIPSASMEPGLLIGDHLLVNKFIYGGDRLDGEAPPWGLPMRGVRRGDVVIFAAPFDPGQTYVKRCLGLAGEVVELDASGLQIDRRRVDESGYTADAGAGPAAGPTAVADDHVFCLGDHRHLSIDSRTWGTVPISRLKGRAFLIYWSIESDSRPTSIARPGTWGKMTEALRDPARWLLRCRWRRSLKLVR